MVSKLVSIEGIDFTGKTTQVSLLFQKLKQQNHKVTKYNFPNYNSEIGKIINRAISGEITISSHVLLALFSANRLEFKSIIESDIANENIILSDRYSESEYAYGLAQRLSKNWLLGLEAEMPKADLIIVLDADPNELVSRNHFNNKRDVFEQNLELQRKVRNNYLQLAENPPYPTQRWEIIDASRSVQEISELILNNIINIIP